ncbi:IS3 family transposase [Leifsonia xyli]
MRQAEVGFLCTARGYRAAKALPASARQLRDELLIPQIVRLHAENYGVYGVRKMHALLRRQGWVIGRDQTGRLMRIAGVRGVKRSKKVFTTKPDPTDEKPKDLVQRQFTADAPRTLWVADVTYVTDVVRVRLCRVRHRRVLPSHRRVERRLDTQSRYLAAPSTEHGRVGRGREPRQARPSRR